MYRFRLRTFLVAIAVIAGACAILGQRVRKYYLTRRLTELTSRQVDAVTYGQDLKFKGSRCSWFSGDEFLLLYLRLDGNHIGDWQLNNIGLQYKVDKLVFKDTSITDRTVSKLQSCSKLITLCLNGSTSVKDSGFRSLSKHGHLRTIDLSSTGISDDALPHIAKIPNLMHLYLDHTAVTDTGVLSLAEATNLERLSLVATRLDGKCLMTLSRLPRLLTLRLSKTTISPSAFDECNNFASLRFLYLDDTRCDDHTLEKIASLCNLQCIFVTNSAVSKDAVRKFSAIHPTCEIVE